jgi:hypothetical protein
VNSVTSCDQLSGIRTAGYVYVLLVHCGNEEF